MIYKTIINLITNYFQTIASSYNLAIRYDNDFRDIPSGTWYKCKINFDDTKQFEIGANLSYRTTGKFIIEIYTNIAVGIATGLRLVDILAPQFTGLNINNSVKFQTPIIQNMGRVEDKYQINVICPFRVDN